MGAIWKMAVMARVVRPFSPHFLGDGHGMAHTWYCVRTASAMCPTASRQGPAIPASCDWRESRSRDFAPDKGLAHPFIATRLVYS
ncbi:MAG: hypothetical protein BGN85_10625 [Alphaproteobacteria bacterium 64-11]|nr:MAG: hypothetical protein BGN85_10625 [Alphaproteobacteria bacterium 64-11]